jgi:membrane protease YdiL (CAAX protease family)
MALPKFGVSAFVAVAFKLAAVLLILVSLVSYFVSLLLGPMLFYYTSDGLKVAARGIPEIPLSIFMAISVPVPIHTNMGTFFGVIWLVYALCFFKASRSRNGFLKSVKNLLSEPLLSTKVNYLLIVPLIATALLNASLLIQQFQETQGVQTGALTFPPQTSPYVILVNLAFAPINEEIAFRITSIGIPLGLFLLYHYRNDSKISGIRNKIKLVATAMLFPERAKAALGCKNVTERGLLRGISRGEWFLILVTSAVFGLAHLLLGGGWEAGKVSTAFLAGLVFGIMFVAYGAYASIILHWFFDYYFTILNMAETTYGGITHSFSTLVEVTNVVGGEVVLLILLMVGALRLADYLSRRAVGLTSKE